MYSDYLKRDLTQEEINKIPLSNFPCGRWQSNYHIFVFQVEYNPITGLYKEFPGSMPITREELAESLIVNASIPLPIGTTEIKYGDFMKLPNMSCAEHQK